MWLPCMMTTCRYELSQSELQKGKYMLAEDDLHKKHSVLREQKLQDFEGRKKKDDKYVQGRCVLRVTGDS